MTRRRVGTISVIAISLLLLVVFTFEPTYVIRVHHEYWKVTGTKAVQEWDYSFYLFGVDGTTRTIVYPGQGYDRYLDINIISRSGTIDLSIEYAGEIFYEVSDASAVMVTLPVDSSNPRITISPYWSNNMTLEGYIKAYCWIPVESGPIYYFHTLLGGGN